MPTLATTNFNIALSVLGGWISGFGLVSYLFKEGFYLSEALISLLAGVAFSPRAANLIRPLEYALGSAENVAAITLAFSRLVLGVQLVLAGVQLPSRYLQGEWKPLALLVGPVMAAMWAATSLLVWALVPGMTPLHALVVGSCVTPTDPVLSAVIVKGKFAESNVPEPLQRMIIAESGLNDGLGYPFLFFALYLVKYLGGDGDGDGGGRQGGTRVAMGLWFGETWGYTVLLSIVYGAVVGWMAKWLLHWAEERKWVDRESFLVFAISLALFVAGTCGMIGSDDVLACFVAGNAFTWDDWFRLETLDDSLQPTVDMLLNISIFLWYGAVCPWEDFVHNSVVPIRRLVGLGVLVLLFRRLPWVLAVHRFVPLIEELRQAVFVGFFGPVGVSAIFYLHITLEFLHTLDVDGQPRADVTKLPEQVTIVVWFIAICSIVVHGLSIPLGKLGYYLPRTLSRGALLTPSDGPYALPPFRTTRGWSAITISRPEWRRNPRDALFTAPAGSGPSVCSIGGNIISRGVELELAGGKASCQGDGPEYRKTAATSTMGTRGASSAQASTPYSGRTRGFPEEASFAAGVPGRVLLTGRAELMR
ncbi:Plasma membrane [Madurella fahalii]|uniref:Plasma membrane n=1 Tax=Madurella fahalii TaxID=1157608 RepID=A0ABQ0G5E1_9PEZI